MNIIHSNNIQEFLSFVENNNNLLEQSTLDRYQELLIVSDISHGEISLLDNSENIKIIKDIKFINGISLIFWAIEENNLVLLEKLIKSGVDVNFVGPNGISVLHFSIIKEYIDVTKLLIKSGVDVNYVGSNGLSVLHFSIIKEYIDVTKLLIKAGADINIKNLDFTALEAASHNNNFDAVLELLKVGAVADNLESSGYILDFIGGEILFGLSIISKIINNEYFNDFIKISEAELLFMRDPIEYILVHNDQAILASNAMDNLMLHKDLVEIYPEILKTKECLDQLPNGIIENLNNFCGRDHFIYEQNDL